MLRIVPFGDRHICFRLNSLTRASSGVIVAHLTPTPRFLDRIRRVDGDMIVCRVPVLHREVVIFEIDVEIGQNEFLADVAPDDPGHLIAIEFDDGIGDLDLAH